MRLKLNYLYLKFFKNFSKFKSKSLIHRHIGLGKDAKCLLKTKSSISLGYKSDFHHLLSKNFNLLLLGCKASEGATYLHHLEALVGVPYRKWIKIKFKTKKNRKINYQYLNYYSRKNSNYKENFDNFFGKINKKLVQYSKKIFFDESNLFFDWYLDLSKKRVELLKNEFNSIFSDFHEKKILCL